MLETFEIGTMASDNGTTIVEAQAAVVDAVVSAQVAARETADEEIERVLDNAEARIEQAESAAQQIADAAVMSELSRQMETFKQDMRQWQEDVFRRLTPLEAIPGEMEVMRGQLAALATSSVLANGSPSIPPNSELAAERIAEATTEVAAILPNSLASDVAENPAPKTERKPRRLFL